MFCAKKKKVVFSDVHPARIVTALSRMRAAYRQGRPSRQQDKATDSCCPYLFVNVYSIDCVLQIKQDRCEWISLAFFFFRRVRCHRHGEVVHQKFIFTTNFYEEMVPQAFSTHTNKKRSLLVDQSATTLKMI